MKKIIAVLLLVFCSASYSMAQEKSQVYATTFRHVVKSYAEKKDVINELTKYSKWKLDTAMRISISYSDGEKWSQDAAFRADAAKFFMAFQKDGKCQLYLGGGQNLKGTYRIEAVKNAFANEKKSASTQEVEKLTKEAMDKIVDKSVEYKAGSNDYFLYIKVEGSPKEAKFEIQILVSKRMVLYVGETDSVHQWLAK